MKTRTHSLNLKIIGLGILIWLVFHIDIGQVSRTVAGSHLPYLGWALLFMFIHILCKFLRYSYILIQQDVKIPFFQLVHFSLAAMYVSFVTPGRLGEVSKAYFIHKTYDVPLNKLLAGSVLDRLFDVYTLLLAALAGFALLRPGDLDPALMITVFLAVAVIPLLFLLAPVREVTMSCTSWLQKKIHHSETWSQHLRFFFSEVDALLTRKIFWGFAATFVAYMLFFASCYCLSLSIDIPLSYVHIAFFIACSNMLSFLPISFAGLGTREACLVFFFTKEGLSSESAMAFSTLIFSFTYVLFGLLGFFCFMLLKRTHVQTASEKTNITLSQEGQ